MLKLYFGRKNSEFSAIWFYPRKTHEIFRFLNIYHISHYLYVTLGISYDDRILFKVTYIERRVSKLLNDEVFVAYTLHRRPETRKIFVLFIENFANRKIDTLFL